MPNVKSEKFGHCDLLQTQHHQLTFNHADENTKQGYHFLLQLLCCGEVLNFRYVGSVAVCSVCIVI